MAIKLIANSNSAFLGFLEVRAKKSRLCTITEIAYNLLINQQINYLRFYIELEYA